MDNSNLFRNVGNLFMVIGIIAAIIGGFKTGDVILFIITLVFSILGILLNVILYWGLADCIDRIKYLESLYASSESFRPISSASNSKSGSLLDSEDYEKHYWICAECGRKVYNSDKCTCGQLRENN